MPKKDFREKHRKKTRYSSDSSDSERERSMRKYRERGRVRSKSTRDKTSKYRQNSSARSTSSSQHSTSSSSSSSSSSSGDKRKNRNKKKTEKKDAPLQQQPVATASKNFDMENLYKDKDTSKVLDDIESETFKQSAFQSQAKSKIVVDLDKEKIMVPTSSTTTAAAAATDESLINPEFLGDDQKRVDKWIKKLYLYRNQ